MRRLGMQVSGMRTGSTRDAVVELLPGRVEPPGPAVGKARREPRLRRPRPAIGRRIALLEVLMGDVGRARESRKEQPVDVDAERIRPGVVSGLQRIDVLVRAQPRAHAAAELPAEFAALGAMVATDRSLGGTEIAVVALETQHIVVDARLVRSRELAVDAFAATIASRARN